MIRTLTQYDITFMAWNICQYRGRYYYAELIDGWSQHPLRWCQLEQFKRRARAAFKRRIDTARIRPKKEIRRARTRRL